MVVTERLSYRVCSLCWRFFSSIPERGQGVAAGSCVKALVLEQSVSTAPSLLSQRPVPPSSPGEKRTPGRQLVQGYTTSNQNLNRPSDSMPAPCPLYCTSPQVKALKKTLKEVKFMFKKRLIPSILNLRKENNRNTFLGLVLSTEEVSIL